MAWEKTACFFFNRTMPLPIPGTPKQAIGSPCHATRCLGTARSADRARRSSGFLSFSIRKTHPVFLFLTIYVVLKLFFLMPLVTDDTCRKTGAALAGSLHILLFAFVMHELFLLRRRNR